MAVVFFLRQYLTFRCVVWYELCRWPQSTHALQNMMYEITIDRIVKRQFQWRTEFNAEVEHNFRMNPVVLHILNITLLNTGNYWNKFSIIFFRNFIEAAISTSETIEMNIFSFFRYHLPSLLVNMKNIIDNSICDFLHDLTIFLMYAIQKRSERNATPQDEILVNSGGTDGGAKEMSKCRLKMI